MSNASEDFPDPDTPVTTVSALCGMSTSMFLRLCVRAPRTTILSLEGSAGTDPDASKLVLDESVDITSKGGQQVLSDAKAHQKAPARLPNLFIIRGETQWRGQTHSTTDEQCRVRP